MKKEDHSTGVSNGIKKLFNGRRYLIKKRYPVKKLY